MGCWFSKKTPSEDGIEEPPKEYSWDKRKKEDRSKFYIEGVHNIENSVYRNDVNDLPITIENCSSCVIFLNGLCKTVTIDQCKDVKIVTFSADSAYIRNSTNVDLVTICGQLRTRDCRKIRLYLHCPTQPVIETTQQVTTYPLPIDFDTVDEILSKFEGSKFSNNWAQIHDFGPVDYESDELNFKVGDDLEIVLPQIYEEINSTFETSPRLSMEKSILPQVPYPPPESTNLPELAFVLFSGPTAEELATGCFRVIVTGLHKAKLLRSTAGKFSSLSLPQRAQKTLQSIENEQIIVLIFRGPLSATDLSSFAEPGCSYFSFGNEARAEYDAFFNQSTFGNHL